MSYLSNHFWGNFSEVGGFPKTLHNFLGWSDEILTLPYKGRYMVKKWQKRPYVIKERPLTDHTVPHFKAQINAKVDL